MCVCVLSHVRLFATPWTVVGQAPLAMTFSRQGHWSGSPFPAPTLVSLALAGVFTAEPLKKILEHLNTTLLGKEIINGCTMFHSDCPWLKRFFRLWEWCGKDTDYVETLLPNLNSDVLLIGCPVLSRDAGQWQAATGPRQPRHHKCEQLTRRHFCTQDTMLVSSLSLQLSVSYVRSSTPYYKTGFVLDFVQLQV